MGLHVVAHSAGANDALEFVQLHLERVSSLTMFEPACFALARGERHVEAHIAALTPVFGLAARSDVSDSEFAARFLGALGARIPDEASLEHLGKRLRAHPPAWADVDIERSIFTSIPVLVVTGGWNPLYDEVATALVRTGAHTVTVEGYGHRPQDAPNANTLLVTQWSGPSTEV